MVIRLVVTWDVTESTSLGGGVLETVCKCLTRSSGDAYLSVEGTWCPGHETSIGGESAFYPIIKPMKQCRKCDMNTQMKLCIS
jgi:hypothetical protein